MVLEYKSASELGVGNIIAAFPPFYPPKTNQSWVRMGFLHSFSAVVFICLYSNGMFPMVLLLKFLFGLKVLFIGVQGNSMICDEQKNHFMCIEEDECFPPVSVDIFALAWNICLHTQIT